MIKRWFAQRRKDRQEKPERTAKKEMITNKQKALLHIAKAELGLSDEEYREIIRAQGGVDSSVRLDDFGLEKVLAAFRRLGFKKTARRKSARARGERAFDLLASEGQRKVLYHLMQDLGWWPARLYGFVRKMTGKEHLEELTGKEAQKVIEGLKSMRERTVQWS